MKKEFNLSEKRDIMREYPIEEGKDCYVYPEEDVKQKIQEAQKELKDERFSIETKTKKCQDVIRIEEIDKVFKNKFGKEMLE